MSSTRDSGWIYEAVVISTDRTGEEAGRQQPKQASASARVSRALLLSPSDPRAAPLRLRRLHHQPTREAVGGVAAAADARLI